jgi:hypothetical protein
MFLLLTPTGNTASECDDKPLNPKLGWDRNGGRIAADSDTASQKEGGARHRLSSGNSTLDL